MLDQLRKLHLTILSGSLKTNHFVLRFQKNHLASNTHWIHKVETRITNNCSSNQDTSFSQRATLLIR